LAMAWAKHFGENGMKTGFLLLPRNCHRTKLTRPSIVTS
jgi:hypothetical protein